MVGEVRRSISQYLGLEPQPSFDRGHAVFEGYCRPAGHLTRVAAAFGLAGLGLGALVVAFRPAALEKEAIGLWFSISFVALFMLHALWWLQVHAWRHGRAPPSLLAGVS